MTEKLFENIANDRLRRLAEKGVVRHYRKGTIIIEEGDEGSTLFVLLKGRLKAFSRDPQGKGKEITYGVYGPGDLLGEMSLDGGPRSANVMAMEEVTCAVVTRDAVKRFIGEEPEFAFDLLGRIISKARQTTKSAKGLALSDAYSRLTELIMTTTKPCALNGNSITLIGSHQAIAQQIGCTREMVSRLFKDLERGGYIRKAQSTKGYELTKPLPTRW